MNGMKTHEKKLEPNLLCDLQIVVNKAQMGRGISSLILKELILTGKKEGFKKLVIPVRPSMKSTYPLMEIDEYIKWFRDDVLPFDPWLRVHVRAGGTIVKPCHKAMTIGGTFAQWEEWTGMKFKDSGEYVVPGALNPVRASKEHDRIKYIEPNVWVLHSL